MLDYWLRKGYVLIEHDVLGSGYLRRFTDAELDALIKVVDDLNRAQQIRDDFQSGALWRRAMAEPSPW
jgi:hypothetical protein